MKSLSCKDTMSDCDFVASGETADEVKKKMYEHAARDHKRILRNMSKEDKAKIDSIMNELLV